MRRICLLGNSHLGLVRKAVSEGGLGLPVGTALTYFACHVSHLRDLEGSGRSLRSRTGELARLFEVSSGGRSSIDLDEFDEFFIVGHGFSINVLVYLAERYRCDSLRGARSERYLLSDDCFSTCAAQQLERGDAMRIACLIRGLTGRPVTVASEPNMGLGLLKSDVPSWMQPHYRAVEEGEDEALAELFRGVCRSLAEKRGLRIVAPIAEIAANGLFNQREFCMLTDTAPEASVAERVNAMLHGNRASGERLVGHLFGLVS